MSTPSLPSATPLAEPPTLKKCRRNASSVPSSSRRGRGFSLRAFLRRRERSGDRPLRQPHVHVGGAARVLVGEDGGRREPLRVDLREVAEVEARAVAQITARPFGPLYARSARER